MIVDERKHVHTFLLYNCVYLLKSRVTQWWLMITFIHDVIDQNRQFRWQMAGITPKSTNGKMTYISNAIWWRQKNAKHRGQHVVAVLSALKLPPGWGFQRQMVFSLFPAEHIWRRLYMKSQKPVGIWNPLHIYIYIGLCMTFIVNYTFYVWYHEFIHVVHEFHCFNFEHPYRSHFHRGISPAPIAMAMDGTRSCEFSATQSWLECNRKLGM